MDFVKQLEDMKRQITDKLNELPIEQRNKITSEAQIVSAFNNSIKEINKAKNDFITSTK